MPTLTPLSEPATVPPAVGSATSQPTRPPLVTGLSATITPRPTNPPATIAQAALTKSSSALSAATQLPGSVRASETPQPNSVSRVALTTEATGTPALVAAVAAPSDIPAGVREAVRVTEQPAAPMSSSSGSSAVLLLLSGALGLIGLIAILWIIRRRTS